MHLTTWLERRWYGAAPPPAALGALAAVYGAVARLRRDRARAALAPKLAVPVIVVGNLSVGGTGKTPFTIWLVEHLREWGWKPGVISRGYGGHAHRYPLRVTPQTSPAECGDEPALMARRLQCPLAVAPRRLDAARLLIDEGGIDILVADDGLQHYALPRDLEICVIDGARGLGNGALLPAGPLREPPVRLREVDLVVVNGGGWTPAEPIAAQSVDMRLEGGEAVNLVDGTRKPLSAFAGRSAHALAGIGHPQRFFSALRAQGVLVIEHAFADHHAYSARDLAFGDALPLLMTEKDAVKCATFALPHHWVVPVSARLDVEAAAHVRKLLEPLPR